MEPVLLTEKHVCEILRLSRTTMANLRRKGLPHLLVGQSVRYEIEKVMNWLYERKEQKGNQKND